MANVLAELFQNTAAAIREKTGEQGKMKPLEFPDKIRAIKAGTAEAELEPLIVTENGIYYPKENLEVGKTYKLRNDYKQEELQAFYEASTQKSKDSTGTIEYAFLHRDSATMFGALLAYGVYGLYISDGHVWIPEALASQIGLSEGWHFGTDLMQMTPADTPVITFGESDIFYIEGGMASLAPLFDLRDCDGFSVVGVNVPPSASGRNLVEATFTENGVYEPDGADGYSKVTVDVPQEIVVGGDMGELNISPLSVTSNGVYYPPKEALTAGKNYTLRNDYTQAELQALYEISPSVSEDGMYAQLLVTSNNNATVVGIMYSAGGYGVFLSDGHIWLPEEFTSQMGLTAGWNFGFDLTNLTSAEIPSVTLEEDWEGIAEASSLFELKSGAFSRVDVNVQGERNTVIKEGTYKPTTDEEVIVIKHNLGFVPDVINIRLTGYIPSETPMLTVFCGMFLSKNIAKDGYTSLTQQFTSKNGKLGLGQGTPDFCEAGGGAYVHSVNGETFTVGGSIIMKHFVGGEYTWVAYGNI